MGSMFGGGSDDSASREMINMEKEAAEEARKKEAERQGRINAGLSKITEAFTGKNEYKKVKNAPFKLTAPKAGTQSGAAVAGLPAGYKYVLQPGTMTPVIAKTTTPTKAGATPTKAATTKAPTAESLRSGAMSGNSGPQVPSLATAKLSPSRRAPGTSNNPDAMGYLGQGPAPNAGMTTTPGKWVVQGPDGKFYEIGSEIGMGEKDVFTGRKTGGIGEDLYNDFRKEFLGYYEPQVADKYAAATNETNFRLARAGTLRSTASANAMADLVKQNKLNVADVRNKADTATGELRTRVENEKAKAISQLYATENPEVAANQATAAVKNITAETPTASPLGDIFTLAAIGGAKYLQGAKDSSSSNRVGAIRKAAQTYVP